MPKVGTVRSFRLTPCYRIQLQDVIAGRHLPPLGRKEFEDFLYFKEHSEENLYFYVWLADYEAQWSAWANSVQNTGSDAQPSGRLAMSYSRAKETFFTAGSLWELNLPQRTVQQLLHDTHPGPKVHPNPSAFAGVRFEVENYLNESLTRFIVQNGGNAGRDRGILAIVIGLIKIGIGLLPIILTSLAAKDGSRHHSWNQRLNRLASIPPLWLGFATLIAGLHGVCVVIFLFGDARQLYPYELRRPNISSPIACKPDIAVNPNLAANSEHETRRNEEGGRRTSGVAVTLFPTKHRDAKTEFIQLPVTPTTAASQDERSPAGHIRTATTVTVTDSVLENDDIKLPEYEQDIQLVQQRSSSRGDGDGSSLGHDVFPLEYATKSPETATFRSPNSAVTSTYTSPMYPDPALYFDFDALPIPPGMQGPDWKSTAFPTNAHYAGSQNTPSLSSAANTSSTERLSGWKRKVQALKNWEWNKERTVFAPLTIVLDPIVTRTQWEIVMRSCLLALVISIGIACASLAIP